MVFKANRKTGRKLKTRVSILLLVCLAMPAVSKDNDLDLTSVSIAALTFRHCGHFRLATNARDNKRSMSSKFSDLKILKRIRTQLKVARNHFRNNREAIAWLYSDVNTVLRTNYHYEWLPSQSLDWYKKYVENRDKNTRLSILLPMLRDSLHNFSVTLDQMRQFSETHYMSNYTARKLVLDDLFKHLVAVLCEVETAMVNLSEWRDPRETASATPLDGAARRTLIVIGGPGWDTNPDHTTMLIQDWGVLITYYRFLKEWLRISRQMIRDQRDLLPPPDKLATDDGHRSGRTPSTCLVRHGCGRAGGDGGSEDGASDNKGRGSKGGGKESKHKRRKTSSSYSVT